MFSKGYCSQVCLSISLGPRVTQFASRPRGSSGGKAVGSYSQICLFDSADGQFLRDFFNTFLWCKYSAMCVIFGPKELSVYVCVCLLLSICLHEWVIMQQRCILSGIKQLHSGIMSEKANMLIFRLTHGQVYLSNAKQSTRLLGNDQEPPALPKTLPTDVAIPCCTTIGIVLCPGLSKISYTRKPICKWSCSKRWGQILHIGIGVHL